MFNYRKISSGLALLIAMTAAVAILAPSCKKDDDMTNVTSVSFKQTSADVFVGESVTLSVTYLPEGALPDSVTFTSDNTNVATVSAGGVVTGTGAGSATITVATPNGKTATCTVNVTKKPVPVTGVKLDVASKTLFAGKTLALTATVDPAGADNPSVAWSSSNTAVATVSSTGVVTAVAPGEATITVTTADGSFTATCTVKVIKAGDPMTETVWKDDNAGQADFPSGGEETVTSAGGWISYADGIVKWTANTTGAPRTDTLKFKNTSVYAVTQLSVNDFKGSYSYSAKTFCQDGFVAAGNAVTLPAGIVFGSPLKGETLSDAAGNKHTNNIGVDGLYHKGLIADAAVEIDYTGKTVSFGLFCDARKAQKDASAVDAAYPYAAFLPEMCKNWTSESTWSKPWYFLCPDLGDPDYEWIWFDVSKDFKTISYTARKAQKISTSNPNSYGPFIIGITVATFSAEDVTFANAKNASASYYNVIYQFNTNSGATGLLFKRK